MTASPTPENTGPLLPMGAVLFGLFTFSIMDAVMKALVIALGTYNAILWRCGVALLIVALIHAMRRPKWPRPEARKVHLQRGAILLVMGYLFFWGLGRVPLAEAIALSFVAPLIALYLAAIFLGETIQPRAIFASLLGLAGVAVMAVEKITGDYSNEVLLGFAAVFVSAVLYAANLVIQRRQALLADPVEISVSQNLIVTTVYLLAAPWFAEMPSSEHWPLIAGGAILSIFSAVAIAWGYARAEAQLLVNLEYSAFIWAALLGWIFFAEPLTATTIAGALLIVAGCIIVSRQRKRPVHVETTVV